MVQITLIYTYYPNTIIHNKDIIINTDHRYYTIKTNTKIQLYMLNN